MKKMPKEVVFEKVKADLQGKDSNVIKEYIGKTILLLWFIMFRKRRDEEETVDVGANDEGIKS